MVRGESHGGGYKSKKGNDLEGLHGVYLILNLYSKSEILERKGVTDSKGIVVYYRKDMIRPWYALYELLRKYVVKKIISVW